MMIRLTILSLLIFALHPTLTNAQEMAMTNGDPTAPQIEFFEKKIRPALVKHCYKCHAEEGDKIKGGLLLDTRSGIRKGGDSGPAVVPGDLNESLLIAAISYEDSSLEMPPKYKLDDDIITDLKKWVKMGAPDPRASEKDNRPAQSYTNTIDIEKGREHWAYQAPSKPTVPATEASKKWARNGIDHFVYSKLAEEELEPSADTDPLTLFRRLSFDLTGLPPLIKPARAFEIAYKEDADRAVSEAVDRFLESPQFGERWGRHWLDVARYAESTGKEFNATLPHAWRYRDYVIDAFNADKPFDDFITEQLAGDLIDADDPEKIVATGFLAIGTKGLNETNARQFRFDLVDEQIDTTTRAFLGTTAACARCHDHKFDPIPMSDYYSMAGIFLSSDTLFGTTRNIQNRRSTELVSLPGSIDPGGSDKSLAEMIDLEFQAEVLRETIRETQQASQEARRSGDNETANQKRLQLVGLTNRIGALEGQIAAYTDSGERRTQAMGMRDREEPFDSQILIRGEEDKATVERAPRGFLQVIQTHDEAPISKHESGRLQLAQWITSAENPLTSRVFANRAWLWMLGQGIVRSVDNFGSTGEGPTHPELLDHLAVRFLEMDWSIKDLVREIANSRTYRMSSEFQEETFDKDPENRLVWRANKRRLDAESIRDSILLVSGRLDRDRPVGSTISEIGDGFVGRNISENQINVESNHRSVYLPVARDLLPEVLNIFDFADPNLIAGEREVTTVPSQALYLMNSEFAQKSSEEMARVLIEDWKLRGPKLGWVAFHLAYSRPPTEEESRKTTAYIERFIEAAEGSGMNKETARYLSLTTFCQSLISSAEFRYLN